MDDLNLDELFAELDALEELSLEELEQIPIPERIPTWKEVFACDDEDEVIETRFFTLTKGE